MEICLEPKPQGGASNYPPQDPALPGDLWGRPETQKVHSCLVMFLFAFLAAKQSLNKPKKH
jgi:hypothetical protein